MRSSSNPVFGNLSKGQQGPTNFGVGTQTAFRSGDPYSQQGGYGQPGAYVQPSDDRPMTIDDVVTKTSLTLGVIVAFAAVSFFLCIGNPGLVMPLLLVGGIGGFVLVMIATFGRKMDSAPITLSYAALEGLFLGAATLLLSGGYAPLIFNAVLATLGVFAGMLFVYKTGAIRVTPKFTRMITAGIVGVLVLMIGNFLLSLFGVGGGDGLGLRSGGMMAIGFSLLCIGLAAMSFLIDFDAADKMIRAGVPSKMAWGVALGLAVTLVWLYIEILRLLSYFRD